MKEGFSFEVERLFVADSTANMVWWYQLQAPMIA